MTKVYFLMIILLSWSLISFFWAMSKVIPKKDNILNNPQNLINDTRR